MRYLTPRTAWSRLAPGEGAGTAAPPCGWRSRVRTSVPSPSQRPMGCPMKPSARSSDRCSWSPGLRTNPIPGSAAHGSRRRVTTATRRPSVGAPAAAISTGSTSGTRMRDGFSTSPDYWRAPPSLSPAPPKPARNLSEMGEKEGGCAAHRCRGECLTPPAFPPCAGRRKCGFE